MGHRQLMNKEQRLKWDLNQYKKAVEARRGHNFAYLTDSVAEDLALKGYKQMKFINGQMTTYSETTAIGAATEFRNGHYYSRVLCIANKLRIKEYAVFYREKD